MIVAVIFFVIIIVILFGAMVMFMHKLFNQDVGKATAHLDQLSGEYAKKEEEIKKQLEDVKRQSQEVLINAQKDADQQKQRVIKDAQEQKEKILSDVQAKCDEMIQQADRARQALMADIDKQIEGRALQRATDLLKETLPDDFRKSIHQRWIEDLAASSLQEFERLRIPEGVTEATLTTAYPLTDELRKALTAKLQEKLGHSMKLKEETDPNIISGWVVTIGSLVLDGSLRFKIQEASIARQKNL